MAKNWDYALMAQAAQKYGGPELYAKALEKHGFQKGVIAMVPVCIGCVLTYAKGAQITRFCKDKLKIVTKKEAKTAEEKLVTGIKKIEYASRIQNETMSAKKSFIGGDSDMIYYCKSCGQEMERTTTRERYCKNVT